MTFCLLLESWMCSAQQSGFLLYFCFFVRLHINFCSPFFNLILVANASLVAPFLLWYASQIKYASQIGHSLHHPGQMAVNNSMIETDFLNKFNQIWYTACQKKMYQLTIIILCDFSWTWFYKCLCEIFVYCVNYYSSHQCTQSYRRYSADVCIISIIG